MNTPAIQNFLDKEGTRIKLEALKTIRESAEETMKVTELRLNQLLQDWTHARDVKLPEDMFDLLLRGGIVKVGMIDVAAGDREPRLLQLPAYNNRYLFADGAYPAPVDLRYLPAGKAKVVLMIIPDKLPEKT